jgi:NTE family protein
MKTALILGAGGPAASAFEIGIVAGLADGGVDVRDADLFVGTSAGALVAVQLAGTTEISQLFSRKLAPPCASRITTCMKTWGKQITEIKQRGGNATEMLERMGELALSVDTGVDRRSEVSAQLVEHDWPARRVMVVAIECETGERRAFERTCDAPLVDAVAASNTLPGVWPTIEIGASHYIDGGMYSTDNADLAAGYDRALIVALHAGNPRLPIVGLEDTTRVLEHAFVIQPDDASQATLAAVNGDVLDPEVGAPMARAARSQGQQLARQIAVFWSGEHAA